MLPYIIIYVAHDALFRYSYSKLLFIACCYPISHMLTHDALRSRLAAAEEALAEQEAVVSRALREKEEALLKAYELQVALLLPVLATSKLYSRSTRCR
jgi:hypothetical protein